jgi:hypothetical protein
MTPSLVMGESLDGINKLSEFSSGPRSYYRRLRSFWALSYIQAEDISSYAYSSLVRHPFVRTFLPSSAIVCLLFPKLTELHEPISQFPSGAVFAETGLYAKHEKLPLLPELCQLALLWILAKQIHSAHRLIEWLFPFLKYPTLWISEEAYDPQEFDFSVALLYRYLGLAQKAEKHKQRALKLGAADPFFISLEDALSSFSYSRQLNHEQLETSIFYDQSLGAWTNESVALTLSGEGTSLGVFRKDSVEVRAFGPQFYPLTQLQLFGIRGIHQAESVDNTYVSGWTRCFGEPNVWLQVYLSSELLETKLFVRWLGLNSEKKAAFVFYVKADTARIGSEVFRSKSLQRYRGGAESVSFNEGALVVTCLTVSSLELIPLAGENCFWGADFLLAFAVNPYDPVGSFLFKYLHK